MSSKFNFHGHKYIIHQDNPKFLAEITESKGQININPIESDKKALSELDVMQVARLMREMGDWFQENEHLRPKK